MTELIERYRHAGSGIVATSATLITLVGCIALFLQSRLGSMHYPRLALTTNVTFEKIIWVAWFALGVSLALLVYDSVYDATGEICDFKFIFLNGNAERMIGMDRSRVLGNNLYDVFPAIRTTDLFERHKRVAETGEPALIEVTSATFQPKGKPARYQIQVVKLSNGIATTISDVTAHYQHTEDLKSALNFNKSII